MKKIEQVAKNFEPQVREQEIYSAWRDACCFKARVNPDRKKFSIVMPPPNITGHLHIGHALDLTLPDVTVRFKRMQGFETLWLPGTDHASIATESKIVEAMKKENLTKADIGRDKFLERAWEWKRQYGDTINRQITRLGASCDWDRSAFTMDEQLTRAVYTVFVDLYKKNLIYRGERIINWCPYCHTSISDVEVTYSEQPGKFYHLRYPLADGSGHIELATTRPETILGDTAVAVHPDDERYCDLIGKTVLLPLVNREIPIIADEYVEKDFGTGVVKITPAHDPNDFEVGLRHNLEQINILTDDAIINENGGKYCGLSVQDARKAVVKDLEKQGYLLTIEDITHNVGHCQRCNTVVEPRISKQWFISMQELAKPALEAAYNKDVRFIPERFAKLYYHWMENIRDWCISRQLWWGHRIPAWYCDKCGGITVSADQPHCCEHCGSTEIRQDEDTLDTWFSSALWPFATMGWPEHTEDLKYFYPTDLLVTGYDILTFWVSRMIFSALEHTGEVPFKDVLLHGLIRDSEGRKISKTLGNGIDPLEVIDQYGTDALRYALISGISPGNDLRFHYAKVEAGRNFINKIWNAFRFVLMNLPENRQFEEYLDAEALSSSTDLKVEDKWILHELQDLIEETTRNLNQYEYGIALAKIYNFMWDNFCDWYIELVKTRLRSDNEGDKFIAQSVLLHVLVEACTLLHPFMPFFTEEIYSQLSTGDFLMLKPWPKADSNLQFEAEKNYLQRLQEVIRSIRNYRSELNVAPQVKSALYVVSEDQDFTNFMLAQSDKLNALAGVSEICQVQQTEVPDNAVTIPLASSTLYLPLTDLIDFAAERERLSREIAQIREQIEFIDKKLQNENFVNKAPAAVVDKERQKRQEALDRLQQSEAALANLGV